jgi:CRISPR system Cascade subunit CasC
VYSKLDSKRPNLTAVLLYVSPTEINWAVDSLKRAKSDDEVTKYATEMTKILSKRTTSAPDIALFGRMLAEHPDSNVDAGCQLAHAISTHAVKTETDFYTAVDDLKPEDTAGADMIGTIAFGSACYYRYARLDWNKLVENLEGNTELAEKTVKAFLLASEAANPSGMGNSHDNNTRPSLLLAVVREDNNGAPWSLVNAFEEPIYSRDGYVNASVKRMEDYWDGLTEFYGTDSVKVVAVAAHPSVKVNGTFEAAKKASLKQWVEAVLQGLK